jgi:predicted XRE-type DNA-binding protein
MKTRVINDAKVTTSSDNVFVDLNFGKTEAADLKRRSELMMQVERFVKDAKSTHVEAARALGVSGARLKLLLGGKIGQFSFDDLKTMLSHAGFVDEDAENGIGGRERA